jgi:hypothetical protein
METLRQCFRNNPQGAGFMWASNGKVHISKGYMTWSDMAVALRFLQFTKDDAVVYHFRISTQAGVNPQMCHPFPVTRKIENTREIEVECSIGAAHNGIIPLTSDRYDKVYSDTAHYVAEFMPYLIRGKNDLRNPSVLQAVGRTGTGKWAIMDGSGYIATIGDFIEDKGILYSNSTYRHVDYRDCGGTKVFENYTMFRNYRKAL